LEEVPLPVTEDALRVEQREQAGAPVLQAEAGLDEESLDDCKRARVLALAELDDAQAK